MTLPAMARHGDITMARHGDIPWTGIVTLSTMARHDDITMDRYGDITMDRHSDTYNHSKA